MNWKSAAVFVIISVAVFVMWASGQTEERERVSRTPPQIDLSVALKKIRAIEKKLDERLFEAELAKRDRAIARLDARIASLETNSSTTDAVLLGIPAIGQIVADNKSEFLEWKSGAERIMEWNNSMTKGFQEKLDAEIAFREDIGDDSDWHWIRRFNIMSARHAELALHHYDILRLFTMRTGRLSEIRTRRESEDPNLLPSPVEEN